MVDSQIPTVQGRREDIQSHVLVRSKQSIFGGAAPIHPVLSVKQVKVPAPERSQCAYGITVCDLLRESQLLPTTSLYNGYCFAEHAVSSLADLRRPIISDAGML